jgi:Dolichyl-phosphate-mannose-protein mannosyltransferase
MLRRVGLERRPALTAGGALALLWLGIATALAVWFSGRIQDWSVMTDELLYAKLATSIAETGSPLPQVHGASVSVYNQLYPLLLAPLFGTLSPPDAFRAAHVLNAFVMTSAVFPAYLLARQILPRAWSFGVAALSALVPWMVLTGYLMTEAAAYPAFLWAILGLHLAIAEPSPRRDLLALAALGLAVLARTQFAALALVLPLAVLWHELGRTHSLVGGAREAVRRHRVLAIVYAVGVVVAAALAVAGSLGDLLGVYAVTVEGSILPADVWRATAEHVDAVAIGSGLVPLVLGGGWLLATAVRPRDPREHALATLFLVTIVVLAVESASFATRFGRDEVVYDRYLFYVVPLLLVGTAAGLAGLSRRALAAGAAAVAVLFAATAPLLPFTTFAGVNVDSPPSVLNDTLTEQSGGLGTGTYVALLGLLAGVVIVLAVLVAPRIPVAVGVFATLCIFSLLVLRSEANRLFDANGLSGRPLADDPGLVLDWVDSVVPEGSSAAVLAFPVSTAWETTAIRWWDVEFWNRKIDRALVAADGNFTYTPYPRETLEVEWATGDVAAPSDTPRYVVGAPRDPRLRLAGRLHASNLGLVVRELDLPYRALWATRGLQADGWTEPGRPATLRIYNRDDREVLMRVRIGVRAAPSASARYRIRAPGVRRPGALDADEPRLVSFPLCIPASSSADVTVEGFSGAEFDPVQLAPNLEGTRRVGILVGPILVAPTDAAC